MHTINPLLEKTRRALQRPTSDSQTEAGQNEQAGPNETTGASGNNGPDRVDAINQLFAEFELAYHNQYYKAYPTADQLMLAKKYWLGVLKDYAPAQIVAAARRLVRSSEFLPSISSVVKACETGISLFGLPTVREAYIEACRATSPKAAWDWSHEAVYHAGKTTDWFLLASEPEDRIFPVFEHYYRELCRRVMLGEELGAPCAAALPEQSATPLSAGENRARMRELRATLGLPKSSD